MPSLSPREPGPRPGPSRPRPSAATAQHQLQSAQQTANVDRSLVAQPVDKESGRAGHAAADATQEVLLDAVKVEVGSQLGLEAIDVEAESGRPGQQVGGSQ